MPVTVDPSLFSFSDPRFDGWDVDPQFRVQTRDTHLATEALVAAAPRLMNVGFSGREWDSPRQALRESDYTPNFVHDVRSDDRGVTISADTKSALTAEMAATMIAILLEELNARGVDGVLTFDHPEGITPADSQQTSPRPPPCRCTPGPDTLDPGPGGYFCPDCGGGVLRNNGGPWA